VGVALAVVADAPSLSGPNDRVAIHPGPPRSGPRLRPGSLGRV